MNYTKICKKCQQAHTKNGDFCSRSCSNSRGPRTEDFKIKVKEKLLKGEVCKIHYSEITGRVISKDNPVRSFWDSHSKGRFIKKISVWFSIPLGSFPETENQLEIIKTKLADLYHIQGFSSVEIKEYFDIPLPDGHMPAFLKQFGIPLRTNSESQTAYIFRNGINYSQTKYKTGWHVDWRGISHFYRSSYELKFYEHLDSKKINYQTESMRIKYFDSKEQKIRVAIPDVIINNKLIVEIKSLYTLDSENMNDKFLAYKKHGFRPMLVLNHKWCKWRESNSHFDI